MQSEVRGRIRGCQRQMRIFEFFFGLCLGQRLFMITDNLSKTLQSQSLSAVSGQNLANLTLKTLQQMRTDDNFKLFYELPVDEPILGRKRKAPKYSILHYVDGLKVLALIIPRPQKINIAKFILTPWIILQMRLKSDLINPALKLIQALRSC